MSNELLRTAMQQLEHLQKIISGLIDGREFADELVTVNHRQISLLKLVKEYSMGVPKKEVPILAKKSGYARGNMIGGCFKGPAATLKTLWLPTGEARVFLTDAGAELLKQVERMEKGEAAPAASAPVTSPQAVKKKKQSKVS